MALTSVFDILKSLYSSVNAGGTDYGLMGLVPGTYDYVSLGYTGDNVTSVIYKAGGAGGTVIATLTLVYSGSNITSVTRS